uniref:Uncharacterized protein n=1 Tax=Arundo donax TaxID=35708 RepID=A0A0A8YZB6_ARUDO
MEHKFQISLGTLTRKKTRQDMFWSCGSLLVFRFFSQVLRQEVPSCRN